MKRFTNSKRLSRAGLVTAIALIIGGITFAALQSQPNTLTGNTIETASANLVISTDGNSFGSTRPGFDFNGLIPGGPAQPAAGNSVYLKNTGTTPLSLKLAVSSVPTNPSNVDLGKVNVLVTTVGSGSGAQSFSLQSLIAATNTGGLSLTGSSLPNGTSQQYKLQVSMTSDALSGSSANIGNIDVAFTGVSS